VPPPKSRNSPYCALPYFERQRPLHTLLPEEGIRLQICRGVLRCGPNSAMRRACYTEIDSMLLKPPKAPSDDPHTSDWPYILRFYSITMCYCHGQKFPVENSTKIIAAFSRKSLTIHACPCLFLTKHTNLYGIIRYHVHCLRQSDSRLYAFSVS
jgi:hypothetical protein